MHPLVSIILPFHNCEQHLSNSIESITKQTLTNFELILVNNNSTDNSSFIAANFAAKDKRVILIDEPRKGIVYALNSGIELAQAKYIACMDACDISYSERLKKQVDFLDNNPKTGVVSCQVNHISFLNTAEEQEGHRYYIEWNNKIITHNDIELNCFIEPPLIHSTVMFRKELIENYGSYRTGDFPEDYELWLRWISEGVNIYKLPEILLDWTDSPNRLTQKHEQYTDQAFFEIKSKYIFDWLKLNNLYFPNVVVWGAGRKSRQRFFILHELGVNAKFYIDLRANSSKKVIEYQRTPPAGRHFILSYVSNRGAREKIKMFLVELGYTEGKDFLCVA